MCCRKCIRGSAWELEPIAKQKSVEALQPTGSILASTTSSRRRSALLHGYFSIFFSWRWVGKFSFMNCWFQLWVCATKIFSFSLLLFVSSVELHCWTSANCDCSSKKPLATITCPAHPNHLISLVVMLLRWILVFYEIFTLLFGG